MEMALQTVVMKFVATIHWVPLLMTHLVQVVAVQKLIVLMVVMMMVMAMWIVMIPIVPLIQPA
jgi:hypothetical protein